MAKGQERGDRRDRRDRVEVVNTLDLISGKDSAKWRMRWLNCHLHLMAPPQFKDNFHPFLMFLERQNYRRHTHKHTWRLKAPSLTFASLSFYYTTTKYGDDVVCQRCQTFYGSSWRPVEKFMVTDNFTFEISRHLRWFPLGNLRESGKWWRLRRRHRLRLSNDAWLKILSPSRPFLIGKRECLNSV